jgi:predicted small lipoprotein YifL
MKKWFAGLAALLVLSLAGCAVKAPVWETVDDAVPVSAQEAGYTLTFAVPEDATPSVTEHGRAHGLRAGGRRL